MRLFVAVDMPKEACIELEILQGLLPAENFTLAKHFHITLKFLGEVHESMAAKVREELREVKFEKLIFKLGKIGFFPDENNIRVIWVGVQPEDIVVNLQKKVDSIIGKEFPDDHPFSAHITLARVKFIGDKKGFINKIRTINVKTMEFEIDSFTLKKSSLSRIGPAYKDLEVYT